jgi:predicted nucleic acid-binding protein
VRGLLDTSVFVAHESGRAVATERLPDELAVSVVTLAELELGVHLAAGEAARARRLATLRGVQSAYVPLPIDEPVASAFAEIVASLRRAGRAARIQDAWIAATARAHDAVVYTQDADFDGLPGVTVERV